MPLIRIVKHLGVCVNTQSFISHRKMEQPGLLKEPSRESDGWGKRSGCATHGYVTRANSLAPLGLSFLTCKMQMLLVPLGDFKDGMRWRILAPCFTQLLAWRECIRNAMGITGAALRVTSYLTWSPLCSQTESRPYCLVGPSCRCT